MARLFTQSSELHYVGQTLDSGEAGIPVNTVDCEETVDHLNEFDQWRSK